MGGALALHFGYRFCMHIFPPHLSYVAAVPENTYAPE